MKFFWPNLDDMKDAHKACSSAAGMAFFIAIATGVVTWLQISGKINLLPGLGPIAYVDVALFILIGIGLSFHSRVAAIAGLLLYIAERVFMVKAMGFNPSQVAAMIIFGIAFVNGVRGAFAWHELKKLEATQPVAEPKIEVEPSPQKILFGKIIKNILVAMFLIATAGVIFYVLKHPEAVNLSELMKKKDKTAARTKIIRAKKPSKPLVAPSGPAIKLKLKSGRSFDGVLIKKNGEGYWVFIDGMGEVFFSVKEVVEAI